MAVETGWNVCDHKWLNFVRWIERCEKKFGPDSSIPIRSIRKTLCMAEAIQARVDNSITGVIMKG